MSHETEEGGRPAHVADARSRQNKKTAPKQEGYERTPVEYESNASARRKFAFPRCFSDAMFVVILLRNARTRKHDVCYTMV